MLNKQIGHFVITISITCWYGTVCTARTVHVCTVCSVQSDLYSVHSMHRSYGTYIMHSMYIHMRRSCLRMHPYAFIRFHYGSKSQYSTHTLSKKCQKQKKSKSPKSNSDRDHPIGPNPIQYVIRLSKIKIRKQQSVFLEIQMLFDVSFEQVRGLSTVRT